MALGRIREALVVTPRTTKILATIVIAGFVILHSIMLFIFYRYNVTPMVYFNTYSIVVYVFALIMLYREYWRTFATVVYLQVFVHMTLAVYYVGWGSGFQLTLIAMNVLGFYSEYAARTMRVKTFHAMTFAVPGMIIYLALYVFTFNRPAPYPLPSEVEFGLTVLWTIVTFVLIIAYLQVFMTIAHQSEDMLAAKATHDRLTSLPNRDYMLDYLGGLASSKGLDGCWAAMTDIDDFKHINDTHGHNCGDFVLQTVASLLRDGEPDYVLCRWGGEEFLMVGRDCSSAGTVLERIRKSIEGHSFWHDEVRLNLTTTIGAARYQHGQTVTEWVNAADKLLYQGKCNGKNQVVLSDELASTLSE